MNFLYLYIDLFTLSGPLLLSFDKKVGFYKYWTALFPSIVLMMIIFIGNDIYFTTQGYWGFNENYLTGFKIANLPIEECLFFVVVPYACVFIYECVKSYSHLVFKTTILVSMWFIIAILLFVFALYYFSHAYTFFAFFGASCLLFLMLYSRNDNFIRIFSISIIIILIPFLIVNGILTGSGIDEEVVWYNENAIVGIRILSIPFEDVFYCIFMLLAVLLPYEFLKNKFKMNEPS